MKETKRQKQVAQLLLEELNEIFRKEGLHMSQGGMISLSKVQITPDLLEARIYLSLFQVADPVAYMEELNGSIKEIRKLLGMAVRHQLRRIPELRFFQDDTLDYVYKMEDIFKKIAEERAEISGTKDASNEENPQS